MKEVTFIRRNIDKWKESEKRLEEAKSLSPDRLADVYMELTADLAFAQTHFPTSRITVYLNNLASAMHNEIYRSKREKWSRLVTFWTQEVPVYPLLQRLMETGRYKNLLLSLTDDINEVVTILEHFHAANGTEAKL